jgi:Uma2 family endonuclease
MNQPGLAEGIAMGLPRPAPTYSADEYLAYERAADERHVFLDGQILAMAGETDEHGDIAVNVVLILGNQLKGTPCRVKAKDTKVRSGPTGKSQRSGRVLFSYPDIVVVCGEREFHDANKDVILNPTTIVEVLSKTTEAFDRGEKFTRYQMYNPTLTDYLLVSQDRPQVEHYSRLDDDAWCYRRHTGLNAVVKIPSIHCKLKLADVYDRINFSDE